MLKYEPETLLYSPILLKTLGTKINRIPSSINFRENPFKKKINKILLFTGKQKFKLERK